jgi:hypothetical protein
VSLNLTAREQSENAVRTKPLELLEGSHLLFLLEQHAGVKAKIEVPDTWKDPVLDTPETI